MTTAMTTQEKPWPFANEKVEVAIKSIAEKAREENISLLYHFDPDDTKAGGYTIAYRQAPGYVGRNAGKMIEVAVAYCSEGDVFSKKIGRETAIKNFWTGRTITVPAMLYGDDELHNCLREMFTWHTPYCGH